MSFDFKMDSVAKVLTKINGLKKKEDRVNALKANGNYTVRSVLQGMFDNKVRFALPEGAPPYRVNQFDEPKALHNEVPRFYLFVESGNPNINPIRREQLFIQTLEAVSADDAELLIAMKDKKCPFKNITKDIVVEAFPGLIQE